MPCLPPLPGPPCCLFPPPPRPAPCPTPAHRQHLRLQPELLLHAPDATPMPVEQEAACSPKSLGTLLRWGRGPVSCSEMQPPPPDQSQNLHFIQILATRRPTSACEFQNSHLRAREKLTRSGQGDMTFRKRWRHLPYLWGTPLQFQSSSLTRPPCLVTAPGRASAVPGYTLTFEFALRSFKLSQLGQELPGLRKPPPTCCASLRGR